MIVETLEWESPDVRLVRLDGLAKSTAFPAGYDTPRSRYYEIPNRQVTEIIGHHSAGNLLPGRSAAERIAAFHVAASKRNAKGKLVGGGRGWPGGAYTFVVPARPDVRDGRLVVYRCWEDPWVTWHTGGGHNRRGVGVCVAGHYYSRHAPHGGGEPAPDSTALVAFEALIDGYLLPRYGLAWTDVLGHFDAGKPTCPGDALESLIRTRRGEDVPDWSEPTGPQSQAPLDTARQRQAALVELGYDPGPVDGVWGLLSRRGLEAYQAGRGLDADGVWGPRTEHAVRVDLAALRTA